MKSQCFTKLYKCSSCWIFLPGKGIGLKFNPIRDCSWSLLDGEGGEEGRRGNNCGIISVSVSLLAQLYFIILGSFRVGVGTFGLY